VQRGLSGGGKLGWATAIPIMVSMSYGSSILILPYTLRQMGIVLWIIFIVFCFMVLTYSTILLKESSVHILRKYQDQVTDSVFIRHPYPKIAEMTVGRRFSKVVEVTMYVTLICEVLAFMLLAANTMNRVVPLQLTHYNRIRVWLLIGYILIMPFLIIGTFKDLVTPAFIAVGTSMIASGCILLVCVGAKYHYGVREERYETEDTGSKEYMFKIFGEILFAASGPALLLPNIIVLMKKPESFHIPIMWSNVIVLCIYLVLAMVPYAVFGQHVSASISETLNDTIVKLNMSPVWLTLLTIAEVSLTIHFTMVSILSANPIFLSIENHYNIPIGKKYRGITK